MTKLTLKDLPTNEQAASILYRAVADNGARLARGQMLRQMMFEQIEAGEKPQGYRADWIRASAMRLIKELSACANEFNEAYSDDRISSLDLVDVVATARGLLTKANESKG